MTVLAVALIVAAVAMAGVAVWRYERELHAGEEYDSIREEVSAQEGSSSGDADNTSDGSASETVPIDFAKLEETCPDAYAWLRIEGTSIDYPIVQAADDQTYYLTHSAAKASNLAGAIFTQNLNGKDFEDPVTVVYGHNLSNGNMFGALHAWEDRAYFNQHRDILVYLPNEVLHYRAFAAFDTDDQSILDEYDFSDQSVLERYLTSVLSKSSMDSIVDDDVTLDGSSKILVLSTCNGIDDQRYVIEAVRVQ